MTYAELLEIISAMTEEQKEMNVTVKVNDEYLPVQTIQETCETETTLDIGHPVLEI